MALEEVKDLKAELDKSTVSTALYGIGGKLRTERLKRPVLRRSKRTRKLVGP